LNTDGGIVICGIREREKILFTGFNRNNENNLINLHSNFQNDQDQFVDLSNYIFFWLWKLSKWRIAIIAVYPLPDDEKFDINDSYYERKLTQDKIIPVSLIQRQRNIK
jgi:hypothetical protein